ncbi:hypothetical protein J4475_00925 [Candidatus Woesearchaeota archaeon]|nr:hypothetical protein [Candidatus Woesearchaeota archaeon]
MREAAILYQCSVCKRKHSFERVLYRKGTVVCKQCITAPPSRPEAKPVKPVQQSLQASNLVMFKCQDCKYRFTLRSNSRIARACPYCSSRRLDTLNSALNSLVGSS